MHMPWILGINTVLQRISLAWNYLSTQVLNDFDQGLKVLWLDHSNFPLEANWPLIHEARGAITLHRSEQDTIEEKSTLSLSVIPIIHQSAKHTSLPMTETQLVLINFHNVPNHPVVVPPCFWTSDWLTDTDSSQQTMERVCMCALFLNEAYPVSIYSEKCGRCVSKRTTPFGLWSQRSESRGSLVINLIVIFRSIWAFFSPVLFLIIYWSNTTRQFCTFSCNEKITAIMLSI